MKRQMLVKLHESFIQELELYHTYSRRAVVRL